MAEGSSNTSNDVQQDAFALADKPIEKVSFRQILTQQRQRNDIGDVIVLSALMNCLEVRLFYLYYGETGVWGTIAAIVVWCALSWPNAVLYEHFRAWFTFRSKQHQRREALRHRQELSDVRLAMARNQHRIPMELLESTEPSQQMWNACRHIQDLLDALAPVAEQGQVSVESIAVVDHIRAEYLPEILGNYVALPQDLRKRPMLEDGRTPEAACVEQAGWIVASLQQIRLEYYQRKANRIDASSHFLKTHLVSAEKARDEKAAAEKSLAAETPSDAREGHGREVA